VRKDSFAWYRGLIASARTGSLDRAAA
jgi:hypothetical protein